MERQLAVIMFTDIVGYTRLMGSDETKAISILKKNREIQKPIIEANNGKWIKELGDGVMASFNNVSDAINAAIKIQEVCNASKEFLLRIGIHLGEVVFENGDVFGDGVNIASRIVSLAEPGGIYISGKIYSEIKNHKNIESIFLGMYDLKNVASSVEIFAISNPGISVPQKELVNPGRSEIKFKEKSSNKSFMYIAAAIVVVVLLGFFTMKYFTGVSNAATGKSIAVLPFINLSSDKNDEYFADGMCDEILTNLSKIGDLKVISRTSVMQYKQTTKNLKEIANELGVSNILEGSVQRSNDRIRINVQLINAKTDEHLWAESYDRENKDVFSIQSEIAKTIARQMNATLSEKEKSSIDEKPTDNLQAYDFYLRGSKYGESYTVTSAEEKERIDNMSRMYREAFRLDPKFVEAYYKLLIGYLGIYWNGIRTDNSEYKLKAKNLLDTLLALNIDKPVVHIANGYYKYQAERDYTGALSEFEQAEKKDPNNIDVIVVKGYVDRRLGKLDEAIQYFQKAIELSPNNSDIIDDLSETFVFNRQPDEGLKEIEKVILKSPDNPYFYISKSRIYVDYKGDFKKAQTTLDDAKVLVDASKLTYAYLYIEEMQGDFNRSLQQYTKYSDSLEAYQAGILSYAQNTAVIYKVEGIVDSAKKYFNKDREIMLSILKKSPEDFRIYMNLGIDYAAIGEKDKALENANRACQLMPTSKDQLIGVVPLEALAVVYTYLNEQDEAIDILEKLLKQPRGFTTTGTIPLYKMHPWWKSLQNNPRFKKMLQGNT